MNTTLAGEHEVYGCLVISKALRGMDTRHVMPVQQKKFFHELWIRSRSVKINGGLSHGIKSVFVQFESLLRAIKDFIDLFLIHIHNNHPC